MSHRSTTHALCLLLFSTPLVVLAGGSGCGGQISGADAGNGNGSGSGSGPGGATCASACNQLPPSCGGSATQSQCLSGCEQAQQQCTTVGYGQDFASLLACLTATTFVCQAGQAEPTASSAAAYNQCIAQASTWEPACSGSMIMPTPVPTTMPGGGPPPPPGPPSCATVCTRIQQQCGSEPMCASQCAIEQTQCTGQGEEALFQDLLDCVLTAPLVCGGGATARPIGCDSQASAVQSACGVEVQDGGVVVDASSGRD